MQQVIVGDSNQALKKKKRLKFYDEVPIENENGLQ